MPCGAGVEIAFHIAVAKLLSLASPERIFSRLVVGENGCRLGGFVDLQERGGAVKTRRGAGSAAGDVRRKDASVAVVHYGQVEFSCGVVGGKRRAVLCIKPVRGIHTAYKRKIPLIPEAPENVASARAVRIINLDDPALMAYREEKIVVIL